MLQNNPVTFNTKKYKRKKSLTGRRKSKANRAMYQNNCTFDAHYKCVVSNSTSEFASHNISTLSLD